MPPLAASSSSPALWLGLLAAACLLVPSAGAEIGGEIRYELQSLEEARIEATLELTGESAHALRDRVDRDDDGSVGALEAAGARSVLEDRFEGETDAYTMDGANYTNEDADVSTEGLGGPVDGAEPITLEIELRAETHPGSGPHVFAIHGLVTGLARDAQVTHVAAAPEDHRIADAQGFAEVETCQARTEEGTSNASLELEAREEACPRPVPAGGLASLLVALAAALAIPEGVRLGRREP